MPLSLSKSALIFCYYFTICKSFKRDIKGWNLSVVWKFFYYDKKICKNWKLNFLKISDASLDSLNKLFSTVATRCMEMIAHWPLWVSLHSTFISLFEKKIVKEWKNLEIWKFVRCDWIKKICICDENRLNLHSVNIGSLHNLYICMKNSVHNW